MKAHNLFNYINEIYNLNHPNLDKKVLDLNYWWNIKAGDDWNKYRMGENKNKFCDHIQIGFFKREDIFLENIQEVVSIAEKLAIYASHYEVYEKIAKSNQHGSSSKNIQDILVDFLKKLGFESEKEGLFKYHNLRPDYYKKLDKGGIIFEVERGKTITNNMDFYDLWKCHICEEANHLFLFVPRNVSHTKNIYESTFKRFKTFFKDKKNHINIDSIFLFGY